MGDLPSNDAGHSDPFQSTPDQSQEASSPEMIIDIDAATAELAEEISRKFDADFVPIPDGLRHNFCDPEAGGSNEEGWYCFDATGATAAVGSNRPNGMMLWYSEQYDALSEAEKKIINEKISEGHEQKSRARRGGRDDVVPPKETKKPRKTKKTKKTKKAKKATDSHHNSDDPLSREGDPVGACDAFDVPRILEHGGDEQKAISDTERTSDDRPTIKITGGEIAPNLKTAVKALAAMEPPTVYQRAQSLCRIAHLSETSETQGCTIPKGTAHIVKLHRPGLTVELSLAARWERYKKKQWHKADPCPKVTGAMLEAMGMWDGIPTLVAISEPPILRHDGTLLAEPGYDKETGLYVEGRFPAFTLANHISLDDAKKAAAVLLEPFKEFPFVEELLDKAVLLAYLFTLVLRALLTTSPLTCVSATAPGAGKGLLVEAANRIVRGRDAATMPPIQGSAGEDETRKRITALLIQGVTSINLDNWTKPIGGESMNALLTATEWVDRVLGVSTTVSLPNRITLAATGNNLSVRGDMFRRSLLLQLDPGVERPELRVFKEKNLLGRIDRDRGLLLQALFTILKGYQQAGKPGSGENLLGRFEPWTAEVCGPIRWLGFPDPLKTQERLRELDPEEDELGVLMSTWFDVLGTDWKQVSDIISAAGEDYTGKSSPIQRAELKSALREIAPEGRDQINSKKLGWYLRHRCGRIIDSFRLERKQRPDTKSKKPQQYQVIDISLLDDR